MHSLHELLQASAALHDHLCPRQVLGVRMGLRAGREFGLDLPQTDKRLFTFMETDGCASDGVAVATGCRLGHRTMRLVDYGKVAATFVDTLTERAVRIVPHPLSRQRAIQLRPDQPDDWHAQLAAYQVIPDEDLLVVQPVRLTFSLAQIISHPEARARCDRCSEEIINEREVIHRDEVLCRACAGEAYYAPGEGVAQAGAQQSPGREQHPPVIGIVGRSGAGKTTLLEKLIPELKRRQYRVGTVKHHAHPGFEIDQPGKDTWRHAQAGSDHVVIAAPDRMASIRRLQRELTLEEIVHAMRDADIVLTDGYRRAAIPRIEVVRAALSREPLCSPQELLALVTDVDLALGVPRFDLDDVAGLADLIEARFLSPEQAAHANA